MYTMNSVAQDSVAATKTQEHLRPDKFGCIKDAREARDIRNEGGDDAVVFAYNTCKKFSGKHADIELKSRSMREVNRDRRNVMGYFVATVDEMLQYAHQELRKGRGFSLYEYIHADDDCVPLFGIENDIKGGFIIDKDVDIAELRRLFIQSISSAIREVLSAAKIGEGRYWSIGQDDTGLRLYT